METNPTPPPVPPLITDPNATPVPVKHVSYLTRIFQGRLNRKNYTAGSLFLLVIPGVFLAYFMVNILLSPASGDLLLMNPYDPNQLATATDQVTAIQSSLVNELNTPANNAAVGFLIAYFILTLPVLLSLQIRRLHDLNHSGWLILLGFIPIVSYFFPLYVAFWSGTDGENKYGVKPISRTNLKEDIFKLH